MTRLRTLRASAVVLLMLFSACTATRVTQGGGLSIAQAQAEVASGQKLRIAVGVIMDKTGGKLAQEVGHLNAGRSDEQQMEAEGMTRGVRDMLTAALFDSSRFIVVERDTLSVIMTEQEFSQSAKAGDKTRIPVGQLEGADLLVLGALTAFDAGTSGGALPIPIPLGRKGNFGVFNVSAKRGYVAMDLRVIEIKTGRVLNSTAVEGRNWRVGLDMTGFFSIGGSSIKLPGLLKYFSNTPVEEALQRMITAATERIANQAVSQ